MIAITVSPMWQSIASLGHAIQRAVSIWPQDRLRRIAVVALLAIQAALLGYSATRHSPTHLEPAFLASGISHWQFGRFELYRVNPPLVRMVAALPVLAVGCETDWTRFYDGPGSRAEFPVGEDFIKANGPASIPLFFYARWACIPFNLIGAYFAYRWARELYHSTAAGFVTLILFAFEPNLLAHGELITPDGACTAFGILAGYTFWRWLKQPTWMRAVFAGGALGLAELSKLSWLILFGLWPLLWLVWRYMEPQSAEKPTGRSPSMPQLATILIMPIYMINVCYLFDGSGTPLKDFQFVSTTLTGLDKPGEAGNRFRATWLGEIPVPLPKQYVLGFDSQKKDLEDFGQKSYLRGEWKDGGWWYYYLYGLLVKVPCGTWGLFALVLITRLASLLRPLAPASGERARERGQSQDTTSLSHVPSPPPRGRGLGRGGDEPSATHHPKPTLRDELVLLLPAIVLFTIVSSQTEFNIHLRYVFPSLGLAIIFLGQAGICLARRLSLVSLSTIGLIGYSLISTALVYPHHLAYFNDFVGGPRNGYKHLLGSSVDWGQDLLVLKAMSLTPISLSPVLLYDGFYSPKDLGILFEIPDCWISEQGLQVKNSDPSLRIITVGINVLMAERGAIWLPEGRTAALQIPHNIYTRQGQPWYGYSLVCVEIDEDVPVCCESVP